MSVSGGFRVDGLISGLQTSDLIEQIMSLERRPLLALQQQQSQIRAKQAAWRDLAAKVQALQTAVANLLNPTTLNGNTVKIGTPNAPITASASSSATPGTYSLLVSQLATSTVARSTAPISADIDTAAPLAAAGLRAPITAGTFSINGVSIAVDPEVDSLDDVLARINASGAGVTASITTVDGRARLQISANTPGGALQLGSAGDTSNFLSITQVLAAPRNGDSITGMASLTTVNTTAALSNAGLATPVSGRGTLTINGVTIDYDADVDSLSTLIARINASDAGVIASYDPLADRFQLQSKRTGSLTIALSDTGTLASALGIADPAAQTLGTNAAYSIDGGVTWRYSTTNTVSDAIPGVTLTFTGTTADPVTLTVGPDVDAAVNAVKTFVNQFNSVLGAIRAQTGYDAATKQAGLLSGDPGLLSVATTLRDRVVGVAVGLASSYTLLGQVGLSFGKFGSAVGTTDNLQLDEAKLRAALTENPNAVFELFAAQPSARLTTAGDIVSVVGQPRGLPTGGRYEIESDGNGNLTARLYDAAGQLVSTTTGTITPGGTNTTLIPGVTLRAADTLTGASSTLAVSNTEGILSGIDRYLREVLSDNGVFKLRDTGADAQLKQLDDQIRRLQDRLDMREESLIRQFSQLEQTLARLQAQSQALAGHLMGLMAGSSIK
ncbi:flagellar filament capping protein FliD [Sphaerobacter sp.]|uniref:flagellar filament capping protein FliD n=1 Tax=Sphaerobacter sp. TaxID=2099654 RepID=UPI001DDDCF69|nr:flagellar filament capping protein FliD [Sphaerobacter sp.]MBX5446032.1 flagellar filament capping protein FliD [Sphaerobacter sp.]